MSLRVAEQCDHLITLEVHRHCTLDGVLPIGRRFEGNGDSVADVGMPAIIRDSSTLELSSVPFKF